MAEKNQKQHVDLHRKLGLRRDLIEKAGELPGAFYVPFCGDGDVAVELYEDKKIYAADIDPERVATAKSRLPDAEIVQADCDKAFPFADSKAEFSLADFDSFAYPYAAFRQFWKSAKLTPTCVLFFTDGERQAIKRSGHWTDPDGKKHHDKTLKDKRKNGALYFTKVVMPWFEEYIKPWKVVEVAKYFRTSTMVYWGVIIQKAKGTNGNGEKKPYKFDEIKREEYLKLLRLGEPRFLAANKVGLDRKTPERYGQRYPAFAEAVSRAEMEGSTHRNTCVENALFEAANNGNVVAIQVWLYNRAADRWTDKRNIQVSGPGGGPIQTEDVTESLKAKLEKLANAT